MFLFLGSLWWSGLPELPGGRILEDARMDVQSSANTRIQKERTRREMWDAAHPIATTSALVSDGVSILRHLRSCRLRPPLAEGLEGRDEISAYAG